MELDHGRIVGAMGTVCLYNAKAWAKAGEVAVNDSGGMDAVTGAITSHR